MVAVLQLQQQVLKNLGATVMPATVEVAVHRVVKEEAANAEVVGHLIKKDTKQ